MTSFLQDMMIVRMDSLDIRRNHYGNRLLSTYVDSSNHDNEKFLMQKAMEFEKRKAASTFLLVEKSSENIIGYFTICAGIDCAYDRPVFEISRVCRGRHIPLKIEESMIGLALQIINSFSENVTPAEITAKCSQNQIQSFESQGFSVSCRVMGDHVRMRYHTNGGC